MIDVQDNNNTASILASIRGKRDAAVKKTAFDIQAGAAQRSAVDTGAQKNSIYVVTADGSTYSDANAAALRANGKSTINGAESLDADDGSEALVAVGVVYGAVNEFTRQPFLTPAVEANRAAFEQAMESLL